ncbi:MAG: hypothetical protein H6594_06550 [Flavobacteriales bacterium]|nr:hypothetical protein [Flavobacteriales bacterium]
MKTRTLALCALLLSGLTGFAQSNFSGFNYQAVVRDANGDPLPDQNVGVQLVISCGSLQPYVEDHAVTTDAHGLMDLVIGEGTPVFGSAPFNTIDWSGCGTWTWNVTVSMDITGGTNYSLVGSQQMKAVPFALNALSTTNQPPTGWALQGSDLLNTNTGNVGIGTSTPAHKLDVQGAINAGGGLYVGDQQTITYDGAGRTEFFDEGGNEHMEFNGYNTTFGGQPTYITDQLAIGLDPALETPAADLHVKGTCRLEDGSQGAGRVLTSDASGNAAWTTVVTSGSYTPTLSGSTGFVSLTTMGCEYSRVGALVNVLCTTGASAHNFGAGTNTVNLSVPADLPVANVQSYPAVNGTFASDHYRNGSDTSIGLVSYNNTSSVKLMIKNSSSFVASAYCSFMYKTSAP